MRKLTLIFSPFIAIIFTIFYLFNTLWAFVWWTCPLDPMCNDWSNIEAIFCLCINLSIIIICILFHFLYTKSVVKKYNNRLAFLWFGISITIFLVYLIYLLIITFY